MRSLRPRRFQAGGPNLAAALESTTSGRGAWNPRSERSAFLEALYPNAVGGKNAAGATGGASSPAGSPPTPAQASQPLTEDQQAAVNNANALRAAAQALTTGPTPIGAQAAQAAQAALGAAPQTPKLSTGLKRGGPVRRFQAGGTSDDPRARRPNPAPASGAPASGGGAQTGSSPAPAASSSAPAADFYSLSPQQQQAYLNGDPNYLQAGAPAAAAPAAAGQAYAYNPLAPPSQNAAPPAGFEALPFGTGTSVVPTPAAYQAQIEAQAASPFMTPAAIANQAIVGNAGLPASLQGNPMITINGQQAPYDSLSNEQQQMLSYFNSTGQQLPSNFLSTYQGPSAAWNNPAQNAATIPSGSQIVNGALVNTTGGGFTFPGSFSGAQPASPTMPSASSPGGIGTSPGTFTANAAGAGVGTGSGATGTAPVKATPQVAQSPTGAAGYGSGLGFRKGGKMPRQNRPRRFQVGGFNAAPAGGNWQQALQQMLSQAGPSTGGVPAPAGPVGQLPAGPGFGGFTGLPGPGAGGGMGGAQAMGAAAGAMPPSPGAAALGAMAGASPGMGQPRPMFGPPPGAAAAGMGAMAGAMPGSPGAAAMGALAGASPGAGMSGAQYAALSPAQQQQYGNGINPFTGQPLASGGAGGMGGTFGPAPGSGAGPGTTYGASATPNQQWGQMLLGSAPGTGLMNQGAANPMAQQALFRNYLGQLQGGLGMTGQGAAVGMMAQGGSVSKFDSAKSAPGNLKTTGAGRGRGFAHGGAMKQGSNRTLNSTKSAPGNLATSEAGKDKFAEGGVAAFAAGGPHEAVKPKTSKTVLRRKPAPMPHSPARRKDAPPPPPYRDQDNEDAMDAGLSPGLAPAAPGPAAPPPGPPPPAMAKGGAACASCGKAHGGACKGMARGGKFAGAKQRAIRRAGGGKWVQDAIKKPGALRAQLHVKPGENIPAGKLAKAAQAPGKLGQRARLAQTMRGFKHAKGGAAACPDCGQKHSGDCKMAAGGVAKLRRGFPNTLKAPKRLARGGSVRGGGAAKKGLKFSGVF